MANIIVFVKDGRVTDVVHNIDDAVVDVVDQSPIHPTDDMSKVMEVNEEMAYVHTKEFGDYDPEAVELYLGDIAKGFNEGKEPPSK